MKISSRSKKPNIVLLDFASEKNRGDAAMQMSTVALVKKYFPESTTRVMTIFSARQLPAALGEFDHTHPDPEIEFVGGVYATNEIFSHEKNPPSFIRRLYKVGAFFQGVVFVGLLWLRFPQYIATLVLPSTSRASFQVLVESDFIIWNGRNIRSHSTVKEPHDVFTLLFHPLLCILLRKPVVCLGTSVWPLKHPLARTLARYVFCRCLFISVREKSTNDYVNNVLSCDGGNKPRIEHLPDLSLYVLSEYAQTITRYVTKTQRPRIGLTIVGEREIGDTNLQRVYVSQMNTLVQYIYKEMNAEFIVVPQVTFAPEDNTATVQAILENIPTDSYSVVEGDIGLVNLMQTYSTLDFLCATRMHSAIFASAVGTPVFSIAYDSGAKWNILHDMGLKSDAVLAMQDLRAVDIIQRFLSIWETASSRMNKVQAQLENKIYPAVEDHMKITRYIYDTCKHETFN